MVGDPLVELPEESDDGPVSTLERRVRATWRSLAQARLRARATRTMLGRALESACSSELSIVVYGSLARNELTEGSDVDWTLLIDGPANHRHLDTAHDIDAELKKLDMKEPSREGAFGAMTFSHDLVHQIGGEDDRNSNTTRRILLLLESAGLDQSNVRRDVITKVLDRYILEEPTFARGEFGARLTEVHLSEVNSASKHEPISHTAMLAYRQIASLIPTSVPVILESIVAAEFIDDEIDAAQESLAVDGPRPRIRTRRSGATPKPLHA